MIAEEIDEHVAPEAEGSAVTLASDEREDDFVDDDEPGEGLSFFTAKEAVDGPSGPLMTAEQRAAWDRFERADREVCSRVFRIYMRESTERGFAKDRSTRRAPPEETLIEPARRGGAARSRRKEPAMSKSHELTEWQQQVLDTHAAILKAGGVPVQRAIAEKLGWEMPAGQTRVSRAMIALRQLGLLPDAAAEPFVPSGEKRKERTGRKKAPSIPRHAPIVKANGHAPKRAAGSQGVDDALRAEIEDLERKAGALKGALAVLEG